MKNIILDSGIKILRATLDNSNNNDPRIGNLTTQDHVYISRDKDISKRLAIQKEISATDYAIICGATLSKLKSKTLNKQTVFETLRSYEPGRGNLIHINISGLIRNEDVNGVDNVICPVMQIDADSFSKSRFRSNITENNRGEHVVTIGLTFPKTYVGKDFNQKLTELLKKNALKETGASYTGFAVCSDFFTRESFKRVQNYEYEYRGERFVETISHQFDKNSLLSNGKPCPWGLRLWTKVEPIVFKINNWDNLPTSINPNGLGKDNFLELQTEEGIVAGVPFNNIFSHEPTENKNLWQNSFIRAWLNGYNLPEVIASGNGDINLIDKEHKYDLSDMGFLHEATQSSKAIENLRQQTQDLLVDINPYAFQFNGLSNDEILKEYIKARVPVFLHGVSGVGKSSRVKAIDPDATRITLRPGMNAEEVDGTLDRETGDYIPPLWYQQICEKCKAEPDKMHVLFIDEITNVKPTVQSLIYSIVLERAGKDGLWPLPENCVVVGAGNETAGNLSAYPLTNALFRRFCHIYYDVDKNEWLKWATDVETEQMQDYDKNKISDEDKDRARIHPSIVAFISSRKDDVLYQELDEEEPTIVTDPRKWEIASNVLYSTKNPKALAPAIGKELTTDFTEFVSTVTITINDVLTNNFKKDDIQDLNLSHRLSTIAGLTVATESQLPAVREFVSNYFGKELLATFDTMWIRNDPERALCIQSLESAVSEQNSLET